MKKILLMLALCGNLLFSSCDLSALIGNSGPFDSNSTSLGSSNSASSDIWTDGGCIDQNKDDYCDDCGVCVAVTFDIISVNDLHGKLADGDSHPGADELTTYIKQTRAQNENTIVLSTGDMWQGAAESNLTKGLIMTEWMNELDFVSMTMGNHEYDWGESYIEANAELAEFPFLAINIYDRDTNARVEYCQPSVTVEQSGVKIGIIGAIGDCYSSIAGDKVEDVYFKTGAQLTALVKKEAKKLRDKGADCIIYTLHDGYSSAAYDVSLSDGYVDLVLEGHSHRDYAKVDANGVYHMQGGGDNKGISHVKLSVNHVNDTANTKQAKVVYAGTYKQLDSDPLIDELFEKYKDQISLAGKVLGKNSRTRYSDELLDDCALLYLLAGEERWGNRYDLVLGGGFMSARAPYNLQAGEVTYGDLQNILPFDNQLVLCSIKGKDLKEKFIFTAHSKYHISLSEYGESIQNNIDDNGTYYLITDTYTSTYAPNNLTEIERYDENVFARDLLAEYIERGGYELIATPWNEDGE